MTTDKTPATLATVKHGGCVQLGTPSSRWASAGEPDPHGNRYDCERAALAMGDLSDDELANAVFLHGDQRPSMAQLAAGVMLPIAYLTAAKDRIRWLSRALVAAQAEKVAQPSTGGQDARAQFEAYRGGDLERDAQGYYTNARTAQDWAMWQAALAARQPVGDEPAFYLSAGAWGHIRVPMTPTRDVRAFRHGFDHGDTELVPFYAAPPAQAVDLGAEPMFYIQDTRQFVGNCPMWWGPNGRGYVTRLDEAGRYTEQEAIKQNRTRDTDIPWPCAEIDAIARHTVDLQHMRPRAERLAELALIGSQAVGNG